jgi:sec-independent protein translocase protein TatC
MSSALDEGTRESLAAGRRTVGDMLRSAQKDLQKVFLVWLFGFLGSFYALRLYVWDLLKNVTRARMEAATADQVVIIAQTPFDVILLQAKIGLVVGSLLALPPFLYFSRDALKRRGFWPQSPVSVWKATPVVLFAVGLFSAGVFYGYAVFFPFVFEFLAENAIVSGFQPRYSIVLWTQFIVLLTLSFGIAAQMPLAMSALSYTEIVPYETFRDKWRYAVVIIFVFGALFSPPDPFTQIMWAFPLLALYAISLYLSRFVVTLKRGSDQVDFRAAVRASWNVVAGAALATGAGVFFFYDRGGVIAVNRTVSEYTTYRLLPPGSLLPVSPTLSVLVYAAVWALLAGTVATLLVMLRSVDGVDAGPQVGGQMGEPTDIDLAGLNATGIQAAPAERFEAMSEEDALAAANQALEEDNAQKAQAILDRYDALDKDESGAVTTGEEAESTNSEQAQPADPAPGGIGDRATRASESFLAEFREEEPDEDDIGGYYHDLRFIGDSLRSSSFRIVATFLLVLSGTFAWLYTGGIGDVRKDFLGRLPAQVVEDSSEIGVIALHPVEVLIFEIKLSALLAALAVVPLIGYYAWPALRERGFVVGRRRIIYGWLVALLAGLVGGFVLGYTLIAPTVISYLASDAVTAEMVISYRISNFFWLIFFTTAGIGLLADIPMLMVLLNTAGVSYDSMRNRWREVTVGIMAFSAVFTSASIVTLFALTIPLMTAYGIGVGALAVLTVGGRRQLSELLGLEG